MTHVLPQGVGTKRAVRILGLARATHAQLELSNRVQITGD